MNKKSNIPNKHTVSAPISLRLPLDINDYVRQEAQRQRRPVSNMIVFMIECYRRDHGSE